MTACNASYVGVHYQGRLLCGLREEDHIPAHMLWPDWAEGPKQQIHFFVRHEPEPGDIHHMGEGDCASLFCRSHTVPYNGQFVHMFDEDELATALASNPEADPVTDGWIVEHFREGLIIVGYPMDPRGSTMVVAAHPRLAVANIVLSYQAATS